MDTFESMIVRAPVEDVVSLPMDEVKMALAQMLSAGKSTTYIANALDKSTAWVREHKKDKEVVNFVTTVHQEAVEAARATIVNGTNKAAETIVDLLTIAPPAVRLSAARDLLDRVGMKAPDKKQIETNVTIKTTLPKEERLSQIKARAARLGLKFEAGVEEAVYEEIREC